MRFIDLFAGIGGFRLGLERASSKYKCVFSNEWLEKPRRIYAKHFGEQPDPRDIRRIPARDVPDADLIVGGFPCATFSIAGKRKGFSLDDTRGTLCFEMFRLARDKRIPYILFENVKGLLNHANGRTFQVILSALDEMGYDAEWELLDSQNFGIPQHRERIFLIANLRGKPRPQVFPITEPSKENVVKDSGEGEGVTQYRRGHFRDYKSEGVPTLTANMGTGGHNVPFIKEVRAVLTPDREKKRQRGRRFKENGEPAFTLGAQDKHGVMIEKIENPSPFIHLRSHTKANIRERNKQSECMWTMDTSPQNKMGVSIDGKEIRKLTPLECERLQGLPDDYTKWLKMDDGTLKQNSDADRYERCGRTVTINVIEAIGRKLINVKIK